MATVNINGKAYEKDALAKEAVPLAQLLAKNARLLPDSLLVAGADFTPEEDKELQTQLQALNILPRPALDGIYNAFSAAHLPALANALRAVDPKTQPIALANYVQILSLLPEPKVNPYFRRFLSNKPLIADIPTIVATAFVEGIAWKRPSGPGHICSLLNTLLIWCDTSIGDDGQSCLNADLRKRLSAKVAELHKVSADKTALDQFQRTEIGRCDGLLGTLESYECPKGYYLTSTRDYLLRSCGDDICAVCMEDDADLKCSNCKSARYCGQACQKRDWKAGHKYACFKVAF
ncbi:hypothetical protein BDY19DRAFT_940551 [Irpex rosettiformis]|uniref:Uncharacterized protein n=1 Tax=Irpex rosettiformis TaxID=378272 RepID=A0ACB8U627_9APHY|nr:hypothetical protein BDY19DRAFT_940551 [Irpex rosettiformis]